MRSRSSENKLVYTERPNPLQVTSAADKQLEN